MRKAPSINICILIAFLANMLGPLPIAMADDFRLPAPGVMVHLSPAFTPVIMRGMEVFKNDPLKFNFIVDAGDISSNTSIIQNESKKLISYFLASLTVPEKDLWVNLSPYEKNRIIPEAFGQTEMGRDTLAQDYVLKQITASLIYPEEETGKKFWKRVYVEAAKKFGSTDIPINTFNKVWIVPDQSVIYENSKTNSVFIVKSTLKVMLEQDYLSMQKHNSVLPLATRNDSASIGANIVREIVIPQLTKEVNEGKNFASLRQLYSSLILATWYKQKLKNSILDRAYINKNKTDGINSDDPNVKNKIYAQYLRAFRKGVYNYIKEESDPVTNQMVPRKYFSGGLELIVKLRNAKASDAQQAMVAQTNQGDKIFRVTAGGALRTSFIRGKVKEIPGTLLFHWRLRVRAESPKPSKFYFDSKHTIAEYWLVDDQLSQYGIQAYHLTDINGNLIIVTTSALSKDYKLMFEAKYHEEEEFRYRSQGKTQQEAHILASAKEVAIYSRERKLTPLHEHMIHDPNISTEELMVLYTEDRSNHLYAVYQELGSYYLGKYLAYQMIFHNAVKAELKQRLAALGEDLPMLQFTNGFSTIEKLRVGITYRHEDINILALIMLLQDISPTDVSNNILHLNDFREQLKWLRTSRFLADHEEETAFVAEEIADSDIPEHMPEIVKKLPPFMLSKDSGPNFRDGILGAVLGTALLTLVGGAWWALSDNTPRNQTSQESGASQVKGPTTRLSDVQKPPSLSSSTNIPEREFKPRYEPARPANLELKHKALINQDVSIFDNAGFEQVSAKGTALRNLEERQLLASFTPRWLKVISGQENLPQGTTFVQARYSTFEAGGIVTNRIRPDIILDTADPRRIVIQATISPKRKGEFLEFPTIPKWGVYSVEGDISINPDGTAAEDIGSSKTVKITLAPSRARFDFTHMPRGNLDAEFKVLESEPIFAELAQKLRDARGDFEKARSIISEAIHQWMEYDKYYDTDIGQTFLSQFAEILKRDGVMYSECDLGSYVEGILYIFAGFNVVFDVGVRHQGEDEITGVERHAMLEVETEKGEMEPVDSTDDMEMAPGAQAGTVKAATSKTPYTYERKVEHPSLLQPKIWDQGPVYGEMKIISGGEHLESRLVSWLKIYTNLDASSQIEPIANLNDPRRIVIQREMSNIRKGDYIGSFQNQMGWALAHVEGIKVDKWGVAEEDIPADQPHIVTWTLAPAINIERDIANASNDSLVREFEILRSDPFFANVAKDLKNAKGDFNKIQAIVWQSLQKWLRPNVNFKIDPGKSSIFDMLSKIVSKPGDHFMYADEYMVYEYALLMFRFAGVPTAIVDAWDRGLYLQDSHGKWKPYYIRLGAENPYNETIPFEKVTPGQFFKTDFIFNSPYRSGSFRSVQTVPEGWGLDMVSNFSGVDRKTMLELNMGSFKGPKFILSQNATLNLPDGIKGIKLHTWKNFRVVIKALGVKEGRVKTLEWQFSSTGTVYLTSDEIDRLKESSTIPKDAPTIETIQLPVGDRASLSRQREGGINLEHVNLKITKEGLGVITSFDDSAQLNLLMKSNGLSPIIYGIQQLTVSMVQSLINQ